MAHARPSSSRSRRLGRLALAGGLIVLAGGTWLLGAEQSPEPEPTTAPTISPTSTVATTAVSTTPAPPASRPLGGAATVGVSSEPITLNPFLDGGRADVVRLIGRPVWAVAIGLDGVTHDPVPVLVDEVPNLDNGGLVENEDGTVTVSYRIRPEARWEDGSRVTGADFAFTYGLMIDEALPIRPDVRALYGAIVPGSLEAGEDTVSFDLTVPSLAYLELFSVVVPQGQVEGTDFALDWNDRLWMSAGPFRFGGWEPGSSITLERNDAYWEVDPETGQQLPYLDRLVFEFVPAPTGVVAGIRIGAIDVIGEPIDPTLIDELETLDGVDIHIRPGPTWEHLSFQFGDGRRNRNPDSLNQNVHYRRAVAHAIDRATLAGAVFGGRTEVLDSPLRIMWPAAASTGWAAYRGNADAAGEALDRLRAEAEVSIPQATLTVNNTPARATAVEEYGAMFAAGGIALTVEPPEETGVYFLETIGPGLFDLAQWAWIPTVGPAGAVDDVRRWFFEIPEAGGSNFSRWPGTADDVSGDEARLAELLEEVGSAIDLEVVRAQLTEIEALMADLVVTLPLYAEPHAGAVRTGTLGGYRHSVMPGGATWSAATWYRMDR